MVKLVIAICLNGGDSRRTASSARRRARIEIWLLIHTGLYGGVGKLHSSDTLPSEHQEFPSLVILIQAEKRIHGQNRASHPLSFHKHGEITNNQMNKTHPNVETF